MEAISLKKTTVIVMAFTAGGFLANANETKIETPKAQVIEAKSITVSFEQLLKNNDSDNNGLLSKKELSAVADQSLVKNFNAIDINADQAISAQEFSQFLTLAKK